MQTITTLNTLQHQLSDWRVQGHSLALVPTMGHLHAGHLALVARAKKLAAKVVVSIFVNPLQFDRQEDLQAYPRTLENDLALLKVHGADVVFAPDQAEIYPPQPTQVQGTKVCVMGLSEILEGVHRPGHFDGVATVVCKLFNMVHPDVAVFGEKDFQQLLLIKQMVADLNIPVRIEAEPTLREADGLAMSSRNTYLDAQQRQKAPMLYQVLQTLRERILVGSQTYTEIETQGMQALQQAGFKAEYVAIRRRSDLALPVSAHDKALIILASAWLGRARLIDNLCVDFVAPS